MIGKDKLFVKNAVLNYGISGLVYIFNFISVPLLLTFLGKENFGIFQTALTLLAWASLSDLGIGLGLRNKVSELYALSNYEQLKKTEGSAFITAIIVAIVMILLGSIFFFFFFDPKWLVDDLVDESNIKLTFYIVYLFFFINFILSLFGSICYGLQRSYVTTSTQLLNFIIYCAILYSFLFWKLPPVIYYASLAYGIGMILSNIIPIMYVRRNKKIWPPKIQLRGEQSETKTLFNISFKFFVLKIITVLLFASDNFIIVKLLGPSEVTEYSIASKLFFFIISIFSILLIQVWDSTAKFKAQGDYLSIKKANKDLLIFIIPISLAAIIVACFFNQITKIWINQVFNGISDLFLILFAIYTVFHCLNAINVNILNGLSKLKGQFLAYSIGAVLNIGLAYYFISYHNMGIVGIILSKTICISIISIMCYMDYRILIKKMIS